jgi:hypothetical protein
MVKASTVVCASACAAVVVGLFASWWVDKTKRATKQSVVGTKKLAWPWKSWSLQMLDELKDCFVDIWSIRELTQTVWEYAGFIPNFIQSYRIDRLCEFVLIPWKAREWLINQVGDDQLFRFNTTCDCVKWNRPPCKSYTCSLRCNRGQIALDVLAKSDAETPGFLVSLSGTNDDFVAHPGSKTTIDWLNKHVPALLLAYLHDSQIYSDMAIYSLLESQWSSLCKTCHPLYLIIGCMLLKIQPWRPYPFFDHCQQSESKSACKFHNHCISCSIPSCSK